MIVRVARALALLAGLLAALPLLAQTPSGYLAGSPVPSPFGTMTFGNQNVGTTSPAQIETATAVISVPTGYAIQVRNVTTGSAEFPVVGGTCLGGAVNLPDTSSCTIQVAFAPAAQGARNGVLSIRCALVAAVGVAGMICNDQLNGFISLAGVGAAAVAQATQSIPALSREMLTALALMLAGLSLVVLRRR